ncbi:MAG: MFS transporter [Bacteroidetes bacterium]|jgi:fucose permease|nr:MFS transporter [Bacteroidota bacterium]
MTDTLTFPTARQYAPAVGLVYVSALLQGLAMVSFPASGTILTGTLGLSSAQYGAIFLPQVALAIIGSVSGGTLARRLGLKTLLLAMLGANALSQLLLAGSLWVDPSLAFPAILLGTASMGLGFGLSGAPLNSFPPLLFPEKDETAVVAVHTLLGLGLAVGPLVVAPFVAAGQWIGFPLLLLSLMVLALAAAAGIAFPTDEAAENAQAASTRPTGRVLFWLFVAVAVLYAFAEGTFSNWAVVYLNEGLGASEATAGLSLSVFWGALVAGRLLTSVLVLHFPARAIWLALPVLMIAAFLLLPHAETATAGIALFGLAGLGCSAFFPLTITLISKCFPEHVSWVSSMMIAALMTGVGIGSFVFGPLRAVFSFEQLYQISALYPALALVAAFLIARGVVRGMRIRELWTGSRCQ